MRSCVTPMFIDDPVIKTKMFTKDTLIFQYINTMAPIMPIKIHHKLKKENACNISNNLRSINHTLRVVHL